MPKTKPDKPEKVTAHHIRADITKELDEQIDLAVALMKLKGNKELGDRSKLIRRAVEEYVANLREEIDRLKAAAAQDPTTKPATRKPR